MGWIPVKERMPEKDGKYLVYAPSVDPNKPFITTAWYNPDNDLTWESMFEVWALAVTHWMPLPEPPED